MYLEESENLRAQFIASEWYKSYGKLERGVGSKLLDGIDVYDDLEFCIRGLRRNLSTILRNVPLDCKVSILSSMSTTDDGDMYISLRDYIIPTINKRLQNVVLDRKQIIGD